MKDLDKWESLRMEYYALKKNQSGPAYIRYLELIEGKSEPTSEKAKYQTNEEKVVELKLVVTQKDEKIGQLETKIAELEKVIQAKDKELEDLRANSIPKPSSKFPAASNNKWGANKETESSSASPGNPFFQLKKPGQASSQQPNPDGPVKPNFTIKKKDPSAIPDAKGPELHRDEPQMAFQLRKTNSQKEVEVKEDTDKPVVFTTLRKTGVNHS